MNSVDPRIIKFVRRHHVMTIATVGRSRAYCANLFYAYMPDENLFVFTSGDETRHGTELASTGFAAASIVLETRTVGKVQGLQMQGEVFKADGETAAGVRKAYIKRFPYAAAADLTLWAMRPTLLKFTDNTLGFGKKLIWKAAE